ncbi:MAG: hypothetical protein DJ555_00775 [Desulfurococcaceae archaeon]|nr:MAG: hypothetical protein DJ555_00775 [Desulfurococcaceae archaeon]
MLPSPPGAGVGRSTPGVISFKAYKSPGVGRSSLQACPNTRENFQSILILTMYIKKKTALIETGT